MKFKLTILFITILLIVKGQNNFEPCSNEFSKTVDYSKYHIDLFEKLSNFKDHEEILASKKDAKMLIELRKECELG